MSSSDAPKDSRAPDTSSRYGRVFMGPDVSRESTIDKLLNEQERELWNRSTEIEYLKRVRERAAAEAKTVIERAQQRAEALRAAAEQWAEDVKVRVQNLHGEAQDERTRARMAHAEAEQARARAHEQGFHEGMENAAQTIAQHEYQRDAAVAAILGRIQEQCGVIFEAWRGELTALSREAVETATGWIMHEEHAAVLAQLLADSVAAMEQRQNVVARVNPHEAELFASVIAHAQARLGLQGWKVEADPAVEPGGLILENDAGRVDNLPSMRRTVVEEALARLTVPYSSADQAAEAAVRQPGPELEVLSSAPPPPPPAQPAFTADPETTLETPSAAFDPASFDLPEFPQSTLEAEPASPSSPSPAPAGAPSPASEPVEATLSEPDPVPQLTALPLPEPEAESPEAAVPEAESPGVGEEDSFDEPSEPEQKAMARAAAAMDQALDGDGGLPADVAAYIMAAVKEPASGPHTEPEPPLPPEDAAALSPVAGSPVEETPEPLPEAAVEDSAAPPPTADEPGKPRDVQKETRTESSGAPFDSLMNIKVDDDGSATSLDELQDLSALLGGD